MGIIPIRLKLLNSNADIKKKITTAIQIRLDTSIQSALPNIKYRTKVIIADRIRTSKEYSSLLSGELQGSFGLDSSKNRVEAILQMWLNSIKIDYSPIKSTTNTIKGGFKISIIDETFKDVIGTSEAIVQSKGGDVPWLEWLLLAGNSIVVGSYHADFTIVGNAINYSRTGKALMLPGGGYSVPSAYSGVKGSNWVTRALMGVEADIARIIQQEIERTL